MTDCTQLAETIRNACLQAALNAYEEAGISGLCHAGRWELAMQAIKTLDLQALSRATPAGARNPQE